jgi:hypothetical protein
MQAAVVVKVRPQMALVETVVVAILETQEQQELQTLAAVQVHHVMLVELTVVQVL